MALQFNGKNIYGITFNGKSLTQVNFNGKPVWYALTNCVITGVARVGQTWTAKTTPSEVQTLCSFQWYRGGYLISGANESTYTTTEDDRGYQLRCVAKIGSASATSNTSPVILQNVSSLTLSGVTEEGYSLTVSVSPSIATGTYQWYRDGNAISGANKSSYTLTHDDAGKYVKCIFTANGNWTGSVSAQTSIKVIGWYYTTGEIGSDVQQQSQYGVTSMRGKKPVTVRTRWWWAGEVGSYNPMGNTKFTFHYKDGTTMEYITGDTYRDTDMDYTLPVAYQKPLDTFDWELRTDVGAGVVRTMAQNYPKFVAWYQK